MKKTITILLIFLFSILNADLVENSRVDTLDTINSFSGLGDFYTIIYSGDYEYILDYLDDLFLDCEAQEIDPMGCSLFSGLQDTNNIFLGRNFDNPQQDVLVGKYAAPGCYENIALNRIADMGIPLGTNYANMSMTQKMNLLKAPYFACDGINETGLSVGVAAVDAVNVQIDPTKDTIWLTHWLREILDHAATVQEAVDITNSYNIVDNFNGQNTLCHHLLITDLNGTSVILEYHDGAFEELYPDVNWQVLTNTFIYNHTLQQMFNLCYRYQLLYDALEDQNGIIYNWENGLDILELPTWGNLSNGTQWSSLYDLNENYLYLSMYRDFDNIARVELETFEILNFGEFYLDDIVIQDADGDGLLEPNEQVYIIPSVTADFQSLGVIGTISSDDPEMIYINNESLFGDIFPDEIVHNASNPFIIEISPNPNSVINLTLEFITNYGYSFELIYPIQITSTSIDQKIIQSNQISLSNHPNPFNPSTTILLNFSSEQNEQDELELSIYNLKGQKIKTFFNQQITQSPNHQIVWNGTDQNNTSVSSGIYFVILKQNEKTLATRKMVLMK